MSLALAQDRHDHPPCVTCGTPTWRGDRDEQDRCPLCADVDAVVEPLLPPIPSATDRLREWREAILADAPPPTSYNAGDWHDRPVFDGADRRPTNPSDAQYADAYDTRPDPSEV